ncbi:MAG TPA: HAD-IA family hydrolase [Verrucomicrobiae bacterium]|nr:HAD-IA family hydrolase [Verrucomicrobiae bacterium]
MIQAITFDLDGVYFPDGKANFVKAIEALGVSHDEVKRVFAGSREMNELYKLGKMTDDEFWGWAAKEWQLDSSPEELIKILIDSYSVDPNVEHAVKSVRQKGYKTLICSNNFPARVNGLQERFHFLDNFDVAVFSYEAGAAKPSEEIFKELTKRSGLPPESIIFADDDEEKLAGAKNLGIVTFLYESFDTFVAQLNELGVHV